MNRKREKVKLKKNAFFRFFQVHKKLATMLVIGVGFVGFFFTINYGRYVKDVIQMFYLRSQNFYFSSDKLTIHGKTYEVNPWSGTDAYPIPISMSSLLNSIKGTTDNISYKVSCNGDDDVDCYIDVPGTRSENRTITTENHTDSFVVTVIPRNVDSEGMPIGISDGDVVSVEVKAVSSSPYVETLSAKFNLVIGNYGVNYEIEDNINDLYFNTYVSNTRPDVTVNAILEIDPNHVNDVFFDMSNPIMQQASYQVLEYTTIGDYQYITKISFDLSPKSSLMVKYYKRITTEDYSYNQGDSEEPVVRFNYTE